MQRRYPERTNSMREKRSLEGGEDELPERKRPALARYITYFSISLTIVLLTAFDQLCSKRGVSFVPLPLWN